MSGVLVVRGGGLPRGLIEKNKHVSKLNSDCLQSLKHQNIDSYGSN